MHEKIVEIVKDEYETIMNSQALDGSFSEGMSLDLKPVPAAIWDLNFKNELSIWLSITVFAILQTKYKSREGEWMLIAQKTKTFLKKQGIKGVLLDELILWAV